MEDYIKEAVEKVLSEHPGIKQDVQTLEPFVARQLKISNGYVLPPYALRKELFDYLNSFILVHPIVQRNLHAEIGGMVTDAKVVICAGCGGILPVFPLTEDMTELSWPDWLRSGGWKQQGDERAWMCPTCQKTYGKGSH